VGEILFSVTAKDCDWSYTRGTGKGGQKKNKTSSAVHCMHRPSGAHGYAEETRSQAKNRQIAFEKMATSKKFKDWHRMEVFKRTGQEALVDAYVKKEIDSPRTKIEMKQDGKWVPYVEPIVGGTAHDD